MEIKKVGVLGCGLMGSGIAQTAASAGFEVVVREVSDELCERGFAGIDKSLARFVEKGTMTAEQQSQILGRLKGTTKFADLATHTRSSISSVSRRRSSPRTPLRSRSRR
jgi:3-hydroxybutyryl-CoA dehydrogenase